VYLGAKFFFPAFVGLLLCQVSSAQEVLIQPSEYGTSFEGPALRFHCVAVLKQRGEEGLVQHFKMASRAERARCLNEILQSLTPEPDFSAADWKRALRRKPDGSYTLAAEGGVEQRIGDRLGVNEQVARGVAALAQQHLIEDPSAIARLIECEHHPLVVIGANCNFALTMLTGHLYGEAFFRGPGPAVTVEGRERAISDWTRFAEQLKGGSPIFTEFVSDRLNSSLARMNSRVCRILRRARRHRFISVDA
jgi:hypothetical protein